MVEEVSNLVDGGSRFERSVEQSCQREVTVKRVGSGILEGGGVLVWNIEDLFLK